LTTPGRKFKSLDITLGFHMDPAVWPVKPLGPVNATPPIHAHLDPPAPLVKREPMEKWAPRDNLVKRALREPAADRTNRSPSIAANAPKAAPELPDPLDLLDLQGQMDNRATLGPLENRPELEPLDLKEPQETQVRLDPLDPQEQMDKLDKPEPKDLLDRRDQMDHQVFLDPLDSPDRQPPAAAKDLLDLQGPLVNLEALENLVLKAHLEPRHRLETMPNTARARHAAERSRKSRRADGLLPEVVDVSFSLFYPIISSSVVPMLLSMNYGNIVV